MKHVALFFFLFVTFIMVTCKKESYRLVDKTEFQLLLDTITTAIYPSELPSIYYHDLKGNDRPAISIIVNEDWKEDGVFFNSTIFPSSDDLVSKTKISVGHVIKEGKILIIELRESWNCRKYRRNSRFSNEVCR